MVLIHWHSSSTVGFFIVLIGVRTWSPAKSHSEYSCFKLCLFTGMYNYEVIHPGIPTRSVLVFISWITDLVFSVKCPLMHPAQTFVVSSTIILVSCFRQLVTSPSAVHLVIHPLVWCMIISLIGICVLGIMFQFSITYGGNSMLSASSVHITRDFAPMPYGLGSDSIFK
jgi:hypothetical protein